MTVSPLMYKTIITLSLLNTAANAFMVIAHRGASGYEPENTLRAFARAIELRAPMIELDVHCCASGELVVIHDETLDRTTNGKGLVSYYSLQELKSLDAGLGEQVPTLIEVFDLVNRKSIINIELKGKGTAVPTAQLLRTYVEQKGWSYDDFLVSSFDIEELVRFSQHMTNVRMGILCEDSALPWKACTLLLVSVFGLAEEIVTPSIVEEAHRRGLNVYVFTVDNEDAIKQLKTMGVDGVFSNYPDLLSFRQIISTQL